MLDDYAIPDKLDEMQGDTNGNEPEEPPEPPLLPKKAEEAPVPASLPEAERQ